MTDGARPGPARAGARGDALGLRLALAFLAVALAAVALLAGLTAAFTAADVSALASRQRAELTSAIAVAAGAAWDRNNSWASADLSPVLDLAARTGAAVQVRDQAGHAIASSPGFAAQPGPQSSAAGRGPGPADRGGRGPVHRFGPERRRPRAADRAAARHRRGGRAGGPARAADRPGRGPADHPPGRPG